MIKLFSLLKEQNKILINRRSPEERQKNYLIALQKRIKQYISDGSKGNLDLSKSPINSLPNNLKVGGDLDLSETSITLLPENLYIEGNLFLYKAKIQSLPSKLYIEKGLYLTSSKIISLPDDLYVGGSLFLMDTPISKKYTEEQLKQMLPGVKGRINI